MAILSTSTVTDTDPAKPGLAKPGLAKRAAALRLRRVTTLRPTAARRSTTRPFKVAVDVEEITKNADTRPSSDVISCAIPSTRQSLSARPVRLVNGNTASDGIVGSAGPGIGSGSGVASRIRRYPTPGTVLMTSRPSATEKGPVHRTRGHLV